MGPNTMLDDIAALIGFTPTMTLVAWYGAGLGNDSSLHIPQEPKPSHFLVRLLGMQLAQRLSDEFGGQSIKLPGMWHYDEEVKRRVVTRGIEAGHSYKEIAVYTGVSERRIQQMRRTLESQGLLVVFPEYPSETGGKNAGKNTLEKCP